MKSIEIPAGVPKETEKIYVKNYEQITKKTNRLFLFAGDQKFEHLNKDFYGPNIPEEVNDPEHLFKIASEGQIGAFVTQLGLIERYGKKYPNINYIVKLNAKTNIISQDLKDPDSRIMWNVEDVVDFKKISGLNICGIARTIYPGSEAEHEAIRYYEQSVYPAHKHGLIAILFLYPRGKNIEYETDPDLIAGIAGVGACLGADFVKIKTTKRIEDLKQAIGAAGNTGVICAGGSKKDEKKFLQTIYEQMHIAETSGVAVGRNVYQRTLQDAIAFTQAIAAVVYDDKSVEEALKIYDKNK